MFIYSWWLSQPPLWKMMEFVRQWVSDDIPYIMEKYCNPVMFQTTNKSLPSGKLTVCYWKWPSRNSGFSHKKRWFSHQLCERLPEGIYQDFAWPSCARSTSPLRGVPLRCHGCWRYWPWPGAPATTRCQKRRFPTAKSWFSQQKCWDHQQKSWDFPQK